MAFKISADLLIRDQACASRRWPLGITEVVAVVGGSWRRPPNGRYPDRVRSRLLLAVGAPPCTRSRGTGDGACAIKADPDWQSGDYHEIGTRRRAATRRPAAWAHLTYRGEMSRARHWCLPTTTRVNEDPTVAIRGAKLPGKHQGDKLLSR